MAIDDGKSRPSSFVPFGRTQAGHLKTAEPRQSWKQQSYPPPLQAHQAEVDGKGKGKKGGKGKLTRENSKCHNCGELGHWRPRMSEATSVEIPDLRCSRTPKGKGKAKGTGKSKGQGKSSSDKPPKPSKGKGRASVSLSPARVPSLAMPMGKRAKRKAWGRGTRKRV